MKDVKLSYERKKGIGLILLGVLALFLPALLVTLVTAISLIIVGTIKIITAKKIEKFFSKEK